MAEVNLERKKPRAKKNTQRPILDPRRIYPRPEAALATGVAVITLIRAYDSGHLAAYRAGRRVLHSGQHLIDWLEGGGKTSRVKGGICECREFAQAILDNVEAQKEGAAA